MGLWVGMDARSGGDHNSLEIAMIARLLLVLTLIGKFAHSTKADCDFGKYLTGVAIIAQSSGYALNYGCVEHVTVEEVKNYLRVRLVTAIESHDNSLYSDPKLINDNLRCMDVCALVYASLDDATMQRVKDALAT